MIYQINNINIFIEVNRLSRIIYISVFMLVLMILSSYVHAQTVVDNEGNVYHTIKIGEQIWMKENLKVTHYNNGDTINEIKDSVDWVNQSAGAWCYFNNDPKNGEDYGLLYNGFSVTDSRGIAPQGWHIPGDDEWKLLEIYLGMPKSTVDLSDWRGSNEGAMLKETDTLHWKWPTGNAASNSTGFTALGNGWRNHFNPPGYTSFVNLNATGQWWSSTLDNSELWIRNLCVYHTDIYRTHYPEQHGCAIRCIKNTNTGLNFKSGCSSQALIVNNKNKYIVIEIFGEQFDIDLYDIFGKTVYTNKSVFSNLYIEVPTLSAGVYFVSIKTQTDHYIRKFIIYN